MMHIRIGQGQLELVGPPGVKLEMAWFCRDPADGTYGWLLVVSGGTRGSFAARQQ